MAKEKKETKVESKFVDYRKAQDVILEGRFTFNLIKSNKTGLIFSKLTSVKDENKWILSGARKDNKGTWALTTITELMRDEKADSKKQVIQA